MLVSNYPIVYRCIINNILFAGLNLVNANKGIKSTVHFPKLFNQATLNEQTMKEAW